MSAGERKLLYNFLDAETVLMASRTEAPLHKLAQRSRAMRGTK